MDNPDEIVVGLHGLYIEKGGRRGLLLPQVATEWKWNRREFLENAVVQGLSNRRVLMRHVLPNILGPCIVVETATIPGYILTEAFLSFIGLGVNPPMPSWGAMINEGYQAMRSYPHVILWPVAILTVTVLAFNYVGDGLRDALDPRLND